MVIPPPKNAVTRPQSSRDPTVRDRHIAQIRSSGRMAWQVATGYNQRSRIETQIGRWKGVIGPQTPIPQLLQANHGDSGRPESSEHNDRTRTACVRTHRLTLPLGKGRIPSPPRSMQQRSSVATVWSSANSPGSVGRWVRSSPSSTPSPRQRRLRGDEGEHAHRGPARHPDQGHDHPLRIVWRGRARSDL